MAQSVDNITQEHSSLSRARLFVQLCGRALISQAHVGDVRRAGGALSPHDWRVVLAEALRQGMAPIVYQTAVVSKALTLAPEDVSSELQARYASTLINVRRIEGQLADILQTFASSAQEILVLKGPQLARRLYPDVALRPMGDIDLLARPGEIQRACAAVARLGYQPAPGQGDPNDFLALTCWTVLYKRDAAPPIELHWRLMPLPSYQRAFDSKRLWNRCRPLSVSGADSLGLGLEDELRYLCVHYAAQHRQDRLIWLIDIARFIRALPNGWNWREWLNSAVELGIASPVLHSLRDCQDMLGVNAPDGAFDALIAPASTTAERRAWALAHASFYHPVRLLAHVRALDTGAERLTLATGALGHYVNEGRDYTHRRLRRALNHLLQA
jgi:hypothetical protein